MDIVTKEQVAHLLTLDECTKDNKYDFINVRNTLLLYISLFLGFETRDIMRLRLSHYKGDMLLNKPVNFELKMIMEIFLQLRRERIGYKICTNRNFKVDALFITLTCNPFLPSAVSFSLKYHGKYKGIDLTRLQVEKTSQFLKENNINSVKEYLNFGGIL